MQFSLAVLLAITSVVSAVPTPLATTSQIIIPNNNTYLCLTAASNADGAAVTIEDCDSTNTGQLWAVAGTSITVFGDKCLDNSNGDEVNGNKLQIWTCYCGDTNQVWSLSGSTVKLANTGFCMDNTGGSLTAGNPTQIWDCTGGPNQDWTFDSPGSSTSPPPPPTGNTISPSVNSTLCLSASSNANNAAVDVEVCDPTSPNQAWTVTNGNIQIFDGMCLDVPNGNTANGQLLQIYKCYSGNTNQLYTVNTDGTIVWTNKNECLDLTNGVADAGTKIQMWKCTSGDKNQVWSVNAIKSS